MQVSRKVALEMQEGKAAEATLERRLQILNELIARASGMRATPAMLERWQGEAVKLELMIESEKIMDIVTANAERFRQIREDVTLACLIAEEVYEPTEEEKIALWLDSEPIERLPIDPRTEEFWDGADDRPSTGMREHREF